MYKVEKPEGAPEWFVPGIVCNVWNSRKNNSIKCVVVWYSNELYFDAGGCAWSHATPIESWEPMAGEWVAAWDEGYRLFLVAQYEEYDEQAECPYKVGGCRYQHIARITDGLDLRCTPEELKQRADWL